MPPIPDPDDASLELMAREHISHEVQSLVSLFKHGNQFPELEGMRQKLAVESCLEAGLIHFRNLAAFLTGSRPTDPRYAGDVVAAHYVDADAWQKPAFIFGTDVAAHRHTMDQIHRRVAHISTHRLDSHNWNLFLQSNAPSLFDAFVSFLTALDHRRQQWFVRCAIEMHRLDA